MSHYDEETITLNGDRLKDDLMDYYGTAMTSVSPVAVINVSKVESASEEELLELAQEANFDLNDYII